jgi:6-phosphogluconolactonase
MVLITGTKSELEAKAASLISESIEKISKTKNSVTLAVVGGKSVSGIFLLLRKSLINWKNVHIFLADERLAKTDSPESNYKVAYDSFLKYLADWGKIPRTNLHPFIYTGNITSDLRNYESELKKVSENFDIVLLSAGEDGHIGALFPNHETIQRVDPYFISTESSPKLPKGRMSSSRTLISRSTVSILLFMGDAKRQALQNFGDPNLSVEECPAKLVKETKESYVLTDLEK